MDDRRNILHYAKPSQNRPPLYMFQKIIALFIAVPLFVFGVVSSAAGVLGLIFLLKEHELTAMVTLALPLGILALYISHVLSDFAKPKRLK